MLKKILILTIPFLILLNSCTETLEPEYINEFDPKSEDYNPTAATYLSITLGDSAHGFEISWKDNSLGESGFEIERKDTDHPEYIKVGTVTADTTHFLDIFIPELNIYYLYRIKTIASNGNYTYSDVANYFTAIFLGPTALTIEHQNSNSLMLYWVSRTTLVEGFYIEMRDIKNPNSTFETVGTTNKNDDHFLIEDLDSTKVYEFKVTAFNTHYQADSETKISVVFGLSPSLLWQSNNHLGTQTTRFSPISNLLAMGASVDNISFYDISTFDYRTTNFAQNFLAFNSTGTKLGILDNWSSANPVSIVDVNSLNIDKVINIPSTGFSFSPDGLNIFMWNENDLILRLVDLSTSNTIWSKNISQIYDAKFNYNGDKIYCNTGTQILILNSSNGNIIGSISPQGYVVSFVITNDEKYLYMVTSISNNYGYGPIEIWDLQTLSILKVITLDASLIEISPDQRFIVAGNSDFTIFRTSDFEKVANINPSWGGMIFSFSFNPYSSLISVCSMYDNPKVFNLNRKWIKRF